MSPASLHWLAGDVKEPKHFSQRVGNVAPGSLTLFRKIPEFRVPATFKAL